MQWTSVIHDKLTVAQLTENILTFYKDLSFINTFTTAGTYSRPD